VCFREATRLEPSHYLATYFLGEDLIRLEQLEEAAVVLTHAIGLDASDPDGYIALANCYRKLNRLVEAQAAVQRALAVDPQNPKARELAARLK
jgi:Flp pilus assembly protein TadD